MKKDHYSQVFIGMLILALGLFPAASYAESEHSGVNIEATAGLRVGEGDNEGRTLESSTTIEARASDERDNAEDDTHDSSTSTKRHQDADRESSVTGRESDEEDMEIEIDQESADTGSSTIDTADNVSNRGELRSFLNHMIKKDDHIADVHVSSTTIETHYEMPAKFLWAIPTSINADVVVNADGSVTVTYPWYAFLFAKDGEIENTLTHALSSSAAETASTSASASVQAHLLNLLFSVLKDSQN